MEQNKCIGYAALFKNAEREKYFVEFPDLPGCFTQGDCLEEALCNAQTALAIYYKEVRGDLPQPTNLSLIQERNQNTTVLLVAVDISNYIVKSNRAIKKTLTVPEWLNELAEKYQLNFSRVLKNGLIAHLRDLDSISEYDRKMLND